MTFAQTWPDFGLTEGVLHIVRIIASVGGAVVGWFVCDALTRLSYRLLYHAATPGALLFTTKACGAAILALLIYFFMPLGGGGGFGFGPGPGGGPGKGPGPGGAKDGVAKDAKPPAKDASKSTESKTDGKRELVEIEILGGKRYKDDGKLRYYLLQKTESPLSYTELRDHFAKHQGKLLIKITLTEDSVSFGNEEDDPTRRLRKLMDTYEQNRDPKSND